MLGIKQRRWLALSGAAFILLGVTLVTRNLRWSWIHTHEEEVCTEPMEGSEPVCWIETERHRHWETDYWETHHTAELMVRGTVQVIQPGRTGP